MNLLIISRPGIRIYQELRRSETAWHALRFYNPIEISVGILVPVNSLSAALSLASDLKYFIRKYGTDQFFGISPGTYCTLAVAKTRYLNRESPPVTNPWPWKFWYWVTPDGEISRRYHPFGQEHAEYEEINKCGYSFEIWCNEPEFQVLDIR
ncbi:MAG: hypothetical protein LUQ07_04315 [Methanospirillum sp.]|nr:hypothetical protein [Methanospirillum sp.]